MDASAASLSPLLRALFALLLATGLVPVWVGPRFPTQDGPSHLYNAQVVSRYHEPERSLWRDYYQLDLTPIPNTLGNLLLAGLSRVFPPVFAERVEASLCLLLLPLALYALVRALCPRQPEFAFLVFPLAGHRLFHLGFYGFCLSLGLSWLCVAWWWRHRERPGLWAGLGLGALSLLTYLFHLLPFLVSLGLIGLLWITESARLRLWRWRPVLLMAGYLPALALSFLFLTQRGEARAPSDAPVGVAARATALAEFTVLQSFGLPDLAVARLLLGLLLTSTLYVALARLRRPRLSPADAAGIACLGFAAVSLVVPDAVSGGSFVFERVVLFTLLFWVVWLAAQPVRLPMTRVVPWVALALMLVQVADRVRRSEAIAAPMAEMMAVADHVEPNRTLLALCYDSKGRSLPGGPVAERMGPFLHAASYIALERDLLLLTNYEATTDHFQVRFRPERSSVGYWTYAHPLSGGGPTADLDGYERDRAGQVDYVLLWGWREGRFPGPFTERLQRQLAGRYELAYTSTPLGLARLYRRR